jgi:antitoxin (DNA-binding transcriptional repressor) of toxin-antitoxin stability system
MQQIDISQAQIQLPQLFQIALQGEEIVITRNNQPILRLTQILPTKRRQRGSARGQIKIAPDFDAPLKEFKEYME